RPAGAAVSEAYGVGITPVPPSSATVLAGSHTNTPPPPSPGVTQPRATSASTPDEPGSKLARNPVRPGPGGATAPRTISTTPTAVGGMPAVSRCPSGSTVS